MLSFYRDDLRIFLKFANRRGKATLAYAFSLAKENQNLYRKDGGEK
jgi:hypothetical protein